MWVAGGGAEIHADRHPTCAAALDRRTCRTSAAPEATPPLKPMAPSATPTGLIYADRRPMFAAALYRRTCCASAVPGAIASLKPLILSVCPY